MHLLGRSRGVMACVSCDSFFRAGLPLVICFGGVLLIILTVLGNNLERKNLHELLRTIMLLAYPELNTKNILQIPFVVLIELGLFGLMSGDIQVDHNMQLVWQFTCVTKFLVNTMLDRSTPSQLSIKDVWELCVARGVMLIFVFLLCIHGCKGGQRLNGYEFLDFGGLWLLWFLRCLIVVCQLFLLIAMEKTACIGMLKVFASPLGLLPLGAARLNWKIATFREFLEEQFLCSVNSHLAPGHTYFGNIAGVRSRIDHVCVPHAMLDTVVSSAGL